MVSCTDIERVAIEYLAVVHRSNDSLLPERSDFLPDDDDDARAGLKIENCEKKRGKSGCVTPAGDDEWQDGTGGSMAASEGSECRQCCKKRRRNVSTLRSDLSQLVLVSLTPSRKISKGVA